MRNTRNLLPEKASSPTLDAALVVLATVLIATLVYSFNGKDGFVPAAGVLQRPSR